MQIFFWRIWWFYLFLYYKNIYVWLHNDYLHIVFVVVFFWSWLRIWRWPNLARTCRLIKRVLLRLTVILSILITETQLEVTRTKCAIVILTDYWGEFEFEWTPNPYFCIKKTNSVRLSCVRESIDRKVSWSVCQGKCFNLSRKIRQDWHGVTGSLMTCRSYCLSHIFRMVK